MQQILFSVTRGPLRTKECRFRAFSSSPEIKIHPLNLANQDMEESKAKKSTVIVMSENLILNQKHREKYGAKIDSVIESLHIIEDGLERIRGNVRENAGEDVLVGPFEDDLPQIGDFSSCSVDNRCDVNSLQLNVKLFLKSYDIALAKEAIKNVISRLGKVPPVLGFYCTV